VCDTEVTLRQLRRLELVGLQRFRHYPLFQRLPFRILHGDEALTYMLADLVDGANMGMI
jgi:hypothetical protein